MFDPQEDALETANLLDSMDMESLSGIENIIESLQEPFEDMERRILISSMVQDAVCRGFLKAMEEDLSAQLSVKDALIRHLVATAEAKEEEILNLNKVLKVTGNDGEGKGKLDSLSQSSSVSVESLHKIIREKEEDFLKKNMEVEVLASRLAQISAALDDEHNRALLLEDQVTALKEQERKESQRISSLLHRETREDPFFERQSTMQTMEPDMKTTYVQQPDRHSKLRNVVVSETVVTDVKELEWKGDVEAMVIKLLLECWYRQVTEVLHNLQVGLAQKDQRILCCETTLMTLKQTAEHLQNNCGISDRPENSSLHLCSTPLSMELNEFSGSYGRKKLEEEEEQKSVMHEELQYPREFDMLLEALIRNISNIQDSRKVKLEQKFTEEKLQHELEIDIISVVFAQEFQDALRTGGSTNNTYRAENTISNNFEDLEAQLESFLELEASKLEIIKSGCSTSIARCEFKLETLMENLAHQVNEMRTKISFVQEAVKQQEWKHMVEQDILITIMWDRVSEMNKKLYSRTVLTDVKPGHGTLLECSNVSLHPLGIKDSFMSAEFPEEERFGKNPDSPLLIRNKDKLICLLKEDIEELRKEKAIIEQKLDGRTEELYSLKRQFWKEREFWVSRLSPPLIKEFEAQVEDLPKHSSGLLDLEEQHMNLERIRYDSLVAELRKEWLAEKEGLLQAITEKEAEIGRLGAQIIENDTTNNATAAATSNLFACIADLSGQVDILSNEKMKNDFEFSTREKEWHDEKRSLQGEVDQLLEKQKNYVARESKLLDKITELENKIKSLRSVMLDQQSLLEKSKEEWDAERGSLLKKMSERESMIAKLNSLSQRGEADEKRIKLLEIERDELRADQQQKEILLASLAEEREVTNALVAKERTENEQNRKLLELELADVKLELQNLQGLCTESMDSKVQFDTEMISEEQIDVKSLQALHEFRKRVSHTIEAKFDRLEVIDEVCQIVKGNMKSFACKETQYKQKLAKQLYNLQKAETEVDLLADEVETLLVVLEEVQMVFDLYAPILQHYPKMTEVAAIVRKEVQLRIDPKYGA